MPLENIVVRGAREHNLKNVNVTIPRNKLVVITGVSGSGKSSLAFDTIYAEGQRRYVESLSAYARQFLGRMDKPDVDYIEGLSPAISIDQKGVSHNPRSTVGTVTEIYDYLRLLFARVGRPHCYKCGRPVERQTIQQIVDSVLGLPDRTRLQILAPMVQRRKGEHKDVFENARKAGFVRVRVNGEVQDLSETFDLDKQKWHTIEIVVDRLMAGDSADAGRVTDSVETALRMAGGTVLVDVVDGEEMLFSEHFACVHCNISFGEMEPRTFSFNNPHGACATCTGLGYKLEVDPDLVIPDKSLSISEGAIQAWARTGAVAPWNMSQLESLGRAYDFSVRDPIESLTKQQIDVILRGTKGKRIKVTHRTQRGRTYNWNTRFEGVLNNLERRYVETESDYIRNEIERYMSANACAVCGGQKLRPEALAVTIGGANIIDMTDRSISQALDWIKAISGEAPSSNGARPEELLTGREKTIAAQILKEIEARLRFLLNIGLDYLTLSRTASTLSGGEAQRIRLATQIGSGLMGVLYVCDEPSIGLHPADDHRLIGTLKNLRDLGNTVLIVEHDEAIMRAADHIVDLGPGAGEHGGHIVATGPVDSIIDEPESLTGQYLGGFKQIPVPADRRDGSGDSITIRGARQNNLRDIDVRIPLGRLVCITGVSGSGKSTLIYEILYKKLAHTFYRSRERPGDCDSIEGIENIDKVVNIDQSPIGPHAAIQPRHIHRHVHPHQGAVRDGPGGAHTRLQAGPLFVQRQGRQVRGVYRRRLHKHRDAVPAGRDGTMRGVLRRALQSGGAGDRMEGRQHRRGAQHDGHRGAGALREHPARQAQAPDDVRRRSGIHPTRPARHAAKRRRGAARQAVHRALQAGHGPDAVHPRRTDDRPVLRRLRPPDEGTAPARGHRQQRSPD